MKLKNKFESGIEEAFLSSKARLDAIFTNMSIGVAIFESDEKYSDFMFTDINPAGEVILGRSRDRIIGGKLTELFPYVLEFGLLDAIHRVNETGEAEYHPDIQYENDELVCWRKHLVLKLESGEIISIFSDETQQKQTELALLDFEGRYRTLFNNANDAIIVHDAVGRIFDVNRVACEMLDYTREDLLKMTTSTIMDSDQPWPGVTGKQKISCQGESVLYETTYRKRDGSLIPIEVSSRAVEYDQKPATMTLARDITERKRAEIEQARLLNQLRQSQKMEAIGTLAGGIAHDFNNILFTITGYGELALELAPDNQLLHNYLEKQYQAAMRAKDLIAQILTFSRQRDFERRPLLIQPVLNESLKILKETLPSNIEVRWRLDPKCGHVMSDPSQIQQIIMNLCTNAYHALRETGGLIDVRLEPSNNGMEVNFDIDEHGITDRCIHLTVGDNGEGIRQSIIDRIFEPYFTTKNPNDGTGLGLSVVHGIVAGMNGHIKVVSQPGRGTVFHIYLPLADVMDHPSETSEDFELISGGGERILLTDDEPEIVEMEKLMLERLGYHVTSRFSSIDALELFKFKQHSFDLVITDLTMPNLSGLELSKQMLLIRPDIPVILCSGFSDPITIERAKAFGIKEVLMKPVAMKNLANTVRRVLDDRYPQTVN